MVETSIRVVQTIGITSAGLVAGATLANSFFLVPRLLESPTPLMLQQWKRALLGSRRSISLVALTSSASFFMLSYDAYSRTVPLVQWKPYLLSGFLAVGILPYSFLFLHSTNKKLLEKAEETQDLAATDKIIELGLPAGEETAHALVDKWATLNLGRAAMLVLSAVVGTWTSLQE